MQELDQAEVGDDGSSVTSDEYVRRLDVSVDDAERVRVIEAGRDSLQYSSAVAVSSGPFFIWAARLPPGTNSTIM